MLIPPRQTTTQQFFVSPKQWKNEQNPRQTKEPANSNMFFMFNSNIYAELRAAHKHILIPSYVIRVI